jgi:tetratricopeptide (TPR) repeat protein
MFGDPQVPAKSLGDDEKTPLPGSQSDGEFSAVVVDAADVADSADAADSAESVDAADAVIDEQDDRDERIGALIERAASSADVQERIRCFISAAEIYEHELHESDKALITLQAALAEDYTGTGAAEALGRLADRLARKQELLDEYAQSAGDIADPVQRTALLLLLARWHEDLGDGPGAEAKLHRALAVDPGAMPVVRAISDRLTAREDWKALAAHLAQAGANARRTADRTELLLAAANLERNRLNNHERATELFGEVLAIDPDAPGALDALAELFWQDENWVRALPMLERLAVAPDRPDEERSRTHQRAALTALRLGEDDRARAHALALVELRSPAAAFLTDWLDIAVSRHWWADVAVIGPYVRQDASHTMPLGEQAELAARIGRAHLEAGDKEAAAEELETALRLDPNHRRAREQLAELREQSGDAAGALEHKKRLAEGVSSPEDRHKLLVEMARAERDVMNNPAAALEMLEEARELQPEDRSILSDMLDLYTDRKQWLPASEILLSLAEHAEPPGRARYLVAAANILHYELGESDQALEMYEKALDDDPSDMKTFDRQDKILAAKQDYKEQARAYRRMIKRIGSATDAQKKADLLLLWRGLAEILRTRLSDNETAITAYEVCVQLDPDDRADREALAELCEQRGPEGLRQAVEQRTGLLEKSDDGPALVRQLRALRRMYHQAGIWDRVYNVCAALTVLQAADEEERAFYEQVAGGSLGMAQAALTEEVWQKVIYDPAEDRRLSLLFSCVAPVVALGRSQEAKAFGLKDRQRLDAASDPSGVTRMFEFGAGVLGIHAPYVYLNPEFTGDAEVINLRELMGVGTAVMISPNIVNGRVEKDVAFVVGRTLALTRADHLVLSRHVVGSKQELTAVVHAAFKLCQPSVALPNANAYEPYLHLFKKALPPQALEPLSSLVPWLIENWRTLDLDAWRLGAERTADRAGLLLCGDLGAAVRVIHATRGAGAGLAVLDLVRWSVSEGHLGLRELLGLALAAAA